MNTVPSSLSASLFASLDLTNQLTMLILGALCGFLAAMGYPLLLRAVDAAVRGVTQWTVSAVKLLLRGVLILKDVALASLSGAASWKTYKKVMPWRNATTRNASSEREILGERTFPKSYPNWYGSENDVDFFLERIEERAESKWKCICQNNLSDILRYEAYCRVMPGNRTEYKTVTIVKDATAEEMTDFYLDDECRSNWDGMLAHTEQLEAGPTQHRCEVVRWIRSFPCPFLTDREYVIGRRIFRRNGGIYTVSRGIEHAAAPVSRSMVRMDVFYSMWRCKDIACPWGTDRPACEVVLLHHEHFKIPEKLARFAACRGMWGFVKSMGPAVVTFVQNRRESQNGSSSSSSSHGADVSGSDDILAVRHRKESPNRLMRTARRAAVATIVTTFLVIRRKHHNQNFN